ncbi:uncharacterized protein LOC121375460 [Gigantopelta aegis]|uniref:uncharacterized protein LOC121375460 n=1 Tax=Gigantopelta aegis TaxID=1735272 RepID=UPI001B888B26|nr:uncharacterized protein LOC121375460 [Gigantopelta aegis]
MSTMRFFLYMCFTALASLVSLTTQESTNLNKKVPYFTSTFFYCESQAVKTSNITSQISYVSWLLPDNTILKQGQMRKKVTVSSDGYNLTVSDINDDIFGYYYCIVLMKPVNGKPSEIKSIQFGLNIDGADFSDLHERYRKSAIIGGIAAAVMAAVFGVGCLVWHYKYASKRDDRNSSIEKKHKSHIQVYENAVYEVAVDDKEVANDEKGNQNDETPNREPVVVESVNIHTEKL